MSISLIACLDLNNSIGYKNQLLCRLRNDMKHFRQLTEGNFICMGRKTFESIGKPLSNRYNIILTRNKKYKAPQGTFVYYSLEDVINEYRNLNNNESELFIIGGSEIYYQAMPYADRICLTIIDHTFKRADSYFPKFSLDDWKPIECIENKADDENEYDHYFVTYERRTKNKNLCKIIKYNC